MLLADKYKTPRITAEIVNAFLTPALSHLHKISGLESNLECMEIVKKMAPSNSNFIVRIDVFGNLTGAVYWNFDYSLAKHIAICMRPPALPPVDTMLIFDAVAELANIMVGHASGALEEGGLNVQFQPPENAENHDHVCFENSAFVCLTLGTIRGRLRMILGINVA